jgi:23S rRNA pseudouridine2605 synthase
MRLARYIAHAGVASRRAAERLIREGRVSVDGETTTDPARDVGERNEVRVEGRLVEPERREYHLLNKPVGVVSTAHDPQGRAKVTDLVPSTARLYPVGRLDADTSGLLILTNDGELANRLMHPRYAVEKQYRATVEGELSERAVEALRAGVELEDGRTAPAHVTVVERSGRRSVLDIVIHEGRKRQVRRMCEAVGHPVIALERTRYGHLELAGLAPGEFRDLDPDEVETLAGWQNGGS